MLCGPAPASASAWGPSLVSVACACICVRACCACAWACSCKHNQRTPLPPSPLAACQPASTHASVSGVVLQTGRADGARRAGGVAERSTGPTCCPPGLGWVPPPREHCPRGMGGSWQAQGGRCMLRVDALSAAVEHELKSQVAPARCPNRFATMHYTAHNTVQPVCTPARLYLHRGATASPWVTLRRASHSTRACMHAAS